MTQIPIRDGLGSLRYINMSETSSGVYAPAHLLYATTALGSSIPILANSAGSLNINNPTYEVSLVQLSAAGTQTSGIMVSGYHNHTLAVSLSGITTNAVIRVEGSSNNTKWGNLNSDGTDLTITSDGTYLLTLSNIQITYIRVNFISESGGTATLIDVDYMGGN